MMYKRGRDYSSRSVSFWLCLRGARHIWKVEEKWYELNTSDMGGRLYKEALTPKTPVHRLRGKTLQSLSLHSKARNEGDCCHYATPDKLSLKKQWGARKLNSSHPFYLLDLLDALIPLVWSHDKKPVFLTSNHGFPWAGYYITNIY